MYKELTLYCGIYIHTFFITCRFNHVAQADCPLVTTAGSIWPFISTRGSTPGSQPKPMISNSSFQSQPKTSRIGMDIKMLRRILPYSNTYTNYESMLFPKHMFASTFSKLHVLNIKLCIQRVAPNYEYTITLTITNNFSSTCY